MPPDHHGLSREELIRLVDTLQGEITVLAQRPKPEEQVRWYRDLIEQAGDGIFVSGPDGVYLDVNESGARLLGLSRGQVIGLNMREIVMEDELPRLEADLDHLRRHGNFLRERRLRHRDGHPVTVEVSAKLLSDGRVEAIVRDLTERLQREEDLRLSEEKFAKAFNASPDATVITRVSDGMVVDANPAFLRRYGLPPGGANGKTVYELGVWRSAAERDDIVRRVREEGIVSDLEKATILPTGETAHSLVSIVPLTVRGEECILSMGHDVTAHRKMEQALRESEQRYRALVEFSPDCIVVAVEDRMVYVNPAGLRMVGAVKPGDRERVFGSSVYDFIPPQRHEEVRSRRQFVLEKGIPSTPMEGLIKTLEGSTVAVESRSTRITYGGRPALLNQLRDITERLKVERALRESERLFRSYFELAAVGFAITSVERGWLAANAEYCRMLGYTWEELSRMTWSQLTHPDDLTDNEQYFRSALAGEIDAYTIDKRFIRKDGRTIFTTISVRCVRKPDGAADYFVSLLLDVTEKKEAILREKRAREEFTQQLIASQEAERRRIAGELHDSLGQNLLLLLNRAKGALTSGGVPESMRQQLEGIQQLAAQAMNEVRQISQHLRPFQLDHLGLTRALDAMITAAAEATGIIFERKLEEVDDVFTPEMATNLYRVAQECLNNIIKHSEARRVRVVLERDIREVMLAVEDDGRGFDKSGRKATGSIDGFGLKNITERVRILGGRLWIFSKPGEGTQVHITIPTRSDLWTKEAPEGDEPPR